MLNEQQLLFLSYPSKPGLGTELKWNNLFSLVKTPIAYSIQDSAKNSISGVIAIKRKGAIGWPP